MSAPSAPAATRRLRGGPQLFAGLDAEALDVLAAAVDSIHLPGGETLMSEGDDADARYVVASGRLRAFVGCDDDEQIVGDISAGEVVGEMALLSRSPRSATVRAVRDCHLLRLRVAAYLLHPDVSAFGLLQCNGLDALIDIGCRHAGGELAAWAGAGRGLPWR